ncbi:hypothetical protein HYT58_00885 [Candidatus Woesearchaeota archaeon]|nr:hypothetical protein [Candidatus Woesearchaeota archaeon]
MIKILVGCPTSDHKEYCLKEYSESINSLSYKNYDILLVDNSKTNDYYNKIKSLGINAIKDPYQEKARDRIISSRNILREYALKNNYDYLLSLEQDVIPPRDVIEKLTSHDKKVVSAVVCGMYNNRLKPMVYMQMTKEEYNHIISNPGKYPKTVEQLKLSSGDYKKILKQLSLEDVEAPRLIENVQVCSLSCVLIHRSVLEKVKFRYVKDEEAFDDVWFSKDTRDSGFEICCDTSVKCKHLITKHQDWSKIEK